MSNCSGGTQEKVSLSPFAYIGDFNNCRYDWGKREDARGTLCLKLPALSYRHDDHFATCRAVLCVKHR